MNSNRISLGGIVLTIALVLSACSSEQVDPKSQDLQATPAVQEVELPSTTTTVATTVDELAMEEWRSYFRDGYDDIVEWLESKDSVESVQWLDWDEAAHAMEVSLSSTGYDISQHDELAYVVLTELAGWWTGGDSDSAGPPSLKFRYRFLPDGDSDDNTVTWTCPAETMIDIADVIPGKGDVDLAKAILDAAGLSLRSVGYICG